MLFELIVNYERVRNKNFFAQNRFFLLYGSELSDKGKLITHI
jgi:hypothetical protein